MKDYKNNKRPLDIAFARENIVQEALPMILVHSNLRSITPMATKVHVIDITKFLVLTWVHVNKKFV
jgi:hypothetical protein